MNMPGDKMKKKVLGYYHKKEEKERKNILKAEDLNNQFHISHFLHYRKTWRNRLHIYKTEKSCKYNP